jgi:hypothetical protein
MAEATVQQNQRRERKIDKELWIVMLILFLIFFVD